MDMKKYAMLKAIVPQKEYVSASMIKTEFNVDNKEAEEMITNLAQEGMVQPYPVDGLHFKVIK